MAPKIALSVGDVYGIGPEILIKAFSTTQLLGECIPIVYGPLDAMEFWMAHSRSTLQIKVITSVEQAAGECINILPVNIFSPFDPSFIGKATVEGGEAALEAIWESCNDAIVKKVDALVTSPVSKHACAITYSEFTGHTELLAALTRSPQVVMMLIAERMRLALVTTHLPLKEVASALTKDKILSTIALAQNALRDDFGIANPSIAVLGCNPHAGDGGTLGTEENEIILPTIYEALARGMNVKGPFASDAFFSSRQRESYDLVIAMYHDQGLIPFKMLAQGRGVNFTAGLRIIRTSPDHGTAFDIAGKGIADAASMIEAIRAAIAIMHHRAATS